ncbi:unnamed protein product [Porites lobata]|uniref:Uncharacterized protein n=1 Tax=Porites lobata TaxID=104759 RepID=A0ABN8N1X2_9CNID|nr:unnamed protein product [Porites lobata]
MSEEAATDSQVSAENGIANIADDAGLKSSQDENQETIKSRETETNELNTGEIVSGCSTAEVDSDISSNCSEVMGKDENFQLGNTSISLKNSVSTESSFVTDEGKHDNLPVVDSNDDAAAGKYEESNIPGNEIDPFTQSVKYLEKHQILRLFQNFAAQIVYKRPENPLQYLVEELERRREETATDSRRTEDSGLLS